MADALPSWYTPEAAPVAQAASPAPVAAPSAAPSWYTPEPTPTPAAPAEAPTTLGTGKYLLGRALDGFLSGGDAMANAQTAETTGQLGTQNSPPIANTQAFGQPDLGAPAGPVQRYVGDLAGAVAGNPVLAAAAPVATVAGSVGGTGGSDLNTAAGGVVPDWLARLAGSFPAAAIGGGLSSFLAARRAATPLSSPLAAGETNPAINRALNLTDEQFASTPGGQFQAPAQATAETMGERASPATIGRTILDKAQSWLTGQQDAASRDFTAIEDAIPAGARSEPLNTMDLLTTNKEGPTLDAPLAAQITKRLNENGARGAGETMPYDALKAWRTEVGAAVGKDPSNGPMKQLYGALSKDMEGAIAEHGGQDAVDAWTAANNRFGETKDFISSRVGNLTNDGMTPEAVHASLATNPAQTATRLKDLLDRGVIDQSDIGRIARGQIGQMSRDANGLHDPSQFLHNAIALRQASPEAEQLLFRGTPAQSAAYDALTERAAALHAPSTPFAKANAGGPGAGQFFMDTARKLGLMKALSYVPGAGEGAEMLGAMLLGGHGGGGGSTNPLWQIPKTPLLPRVAGSLPVQALGFGTTGSALSLPNSRQQ